MTLFENLPKPVLEKESRKVISGRIRCGSHTHLTRGTFISHSKADVIATALQRIETKED